MLFNGCIKTVNDCRRVKQVFSGCLKASGRLKKPACAGLVKSRRAAGLVTLPVFPDELVEKVTEGDRFTDGFKVIGHTTVGLEKIRLVFVITISADIESST